MWSQRKLATHDFYDVAKTRGGKCFFDRLSHYIGSFSGNMFSGICECMNSTGPVAQWIRHRPTEPGIAGSSPAGVIFQVSHPVIV